MNGERAAAGRGPGAGGCELRKRIALSQSRSSVPMPTQQSVRCGRLMKCALPTSRVQRTFQERSQTVHALKSRRHNKSTFSGTGASSPMRDCRLDGPPVFPISKPHTPSHTHRDQTPRETRRRSHPDRDAHKHASQTRSHRIAPRRPTRISRQRTRTIPRAARQTPQSANGRARSRTPAARESRLPTGSLSSCVAAAPPVFLAGILVLGRAPWSGRVVCSCRGVCSQHLVVPP